MKIRIRFVQGLLAVMILVGSQARADFLGLAPGDYTITLEDVGTPGGSGLLNNMVGRVHIPSGTVNVANFSWYFPIRDSAGPVLFDWTGQDLHVSQGPDGSSVAYEEANGPARLCDLNAFCFPIFELYYIPNRMNGICAEGACSQFWRSPYTYLVFNTGAWSAQRIPEPSTMFLFACGLIFLALIWRKRSRMGSR